MKTSSNEYLKKIGKYFLDCIDLRDFQNYNKAKSDKQKFDAVMSEFENYLPNNYGNLQNHFAAWLSGLPTIMTIEFENCKIIELAEKLAETKFEEKRHDDIIENYFNFMASKFFQVYKKLEKDNDFLKG